MKKKNKHYYPIKIKMTPGESFVNEPSGISRVVENYIKRFDKFGIQLVKDGEEFDLSVAHAGMVGGDCDVSILHGMYFTGDYPSANYENVVNGRIVESLRSAYAVTVPSNWVSEILKRDMHITPFVVPHGIEPKEWKTDTQIDDNYFLYNKNRDGVDVCNSTHVDKLAKMAKGVRFMSTFSKTQLPNMKVIGVQDHNVMKSLVQKCTGYLSLTKETFGIGVLEALASGKPVLGWSVGGNVDIVRHGVNGYLAEYGDYEDLINGLEYVIEHKDILSKNALSSSYLWSWDNSLEKLRSVFEYALEKKNEDPTVSVIIPSFNYANKLEECVDSIVKQSYKPKDIIVVDDGSTDDTLDKVVEISDKYVDSDVKIRYIKKENGGVATARNLGAKHSDSKYLCFIDADDRIAQSYLMECVSHLESDPSLYIAYTGLTTVNKDGSRITSKWPDGWNFDLQISRKNQVPTCCVMRKEVIERTGGYRQRFAPLGAGSEDADLWTRSGALGMKASQVTKDPLFLYTAGTGHTSKPGYREVDWLGWNGFIRTGIHPFASYATPKNKISHKVYQYDEPVVSVIVPIGPGHEKNFMDAFDSVEGQTYKNWELIAVNDTGYEIDFTGFPFAKVIKTDKPKSGPGVARNLGAKNANGKLLVFLDADDWLDPSALELMLVHFSLNPGIVYTDYIGHSTIDPSSINDFRGRVISYDERTKRAELRHKSSEYDCEKAQKQPADPLYHWCLVTCLVPKNWHNEIGGFDEKMKSWEDVDYHWRMSHLGKCYYHLGEELVHYNFDSGNRRNLANPENNIELARELMAYMAKKYNEVENEMASCRSCGSNSTSPSVAQANNSAFMSTVKNADNEYLMIVYNHPNKGTHRVIGPASGKDYGYRAGGEKFLVHFTDVRLMPNLFVNSVDPNTIESLKQSIDIVSESKPKELKPPKSIDGVPVASKDKPFDINIIPGITPGIAQKLTKSGVDSREKFLSLTKDYLVKIDGISSSRAGVIMSVIEKMKDDVD